MRPGSGLPLPSFRPAWREAIVRYGLLEVIDQGHIYPSVTQAVKGYRQENGIDPPDE
jgi:hypothetical protein